MTIAKAMLTTAICTGVAAFTGALLGRSLGYFAPGYYRAVLYRGQEATFDPADIGTGLGLNAGVFTGVVVGLLIVAIVTWHDIRTGKTRQSAASKWPVQPSNAGESLRGVSEGIKTLKGS
jgi:hypothetical protein